MQKLNVLDKNKARRMIEEQLILVPDEIKISLNKELLESLIFEERMTETGIKKYPVWTGPFLRKIDLHEISFENVSFDAIDALKNNVIFYYGLSEYLIDFSYTNIYVDFSKLANPCIRNCNLSHVNLLNSNANSLIIIEKADLSYTGANFFLTDGTEYYFADSNLSGIDLSHFEFDSEILCEFNKVGILNTNLTNTSIRINHTNEKYEKILFSNINDGNLNGCYVNETLIYNNANICPKKEYQDFKKQVFSNISESFQCIIKR